VAVGQAELTTGHEEAFIGYVWVVCGTSTCNRACLVVFPLTPFVSAVSAPLAKLYRMLAMLNLVKWLRLSRLDARHPLFDWLGPRI